MRLDDIIRLCLYRAELGAKLCAEASSQVCIERHHMVNCIHCFSHSILYLQNGRHIETLTLVIDYEKMSIRRHYYWPGIQMAKKVYQWKHFSSLVPRFSLHPPRNNPAGRSKVIRGFIARKAEEEPGNKARIFQCTSLSQFAAAVLGVGSRKCIFC